MSILSSVFSILAPERPVNYDAMWRVIDTMQNRADKKREEELAARANVSDIAAKFGANITGLPNDTRATRKKFEELYIDFKYDFEKYASSGYASSYTGSIISLNHINKLQQIGTDIYHSNKRELDYNAAKELVIKSNTSLIVPYAAISDIAYNQKTLLRNYNANSTNDLTFTGIFESYANDDDYSGSDMNELLESSRINPMEAINYFSSLLSIVGSLSSDNYNDVIGRIDKLNNTSPNVPVDQKTKLKDLIITQSSSNRKNLDYLIKGIEDGTLMTKDMELAIKTKILNDAISFSYNGQYIDQKAAMDLINETNSTYQNKLVHTITTITDIAERNNVNKTLLGNTPGQDPKITLAKQYYTSHLNQQTPKTITYNDVNNGWSTKAIATSSIPMNTELQKYIIGTIAKNPKIVVYKTDVNNKIVNSQMYAYDPSNIDRNEQYYNTYSDSGYSIENMYTGKVNPPASISLNIAKVLNDAFIESDHLNTKTETIITKEEAESIFFYGLTNYKIDDKDPANLHVLEFARQNKTRDYNIGIDFYAKTFSDALSDLEKVVTISDEDRQLLKQVDAITYANWKPEERKEYHDKQASILNKYAIKSAAPVAYDIYAAKGSKLTFQDIENALRLQKNADGTYRFENYSDITFPLFDSELLVKDQDRGLISTTKQ